MNTLVVFDFDYTLAKTTENIWIWSPRGTRTHNNKSYFLAHPTEIQKITIADDEYLDNESFFEFYDINLDRTKIIYPIFLYLELFTKDPKYQILILSARPQSVENKIYKLLHANNIKKDIVTFKGLENSNPNEKIIYIEEYVKDQHIDNIILFEDNQNVISLAKEKLNYKKLRLFLVSLINNEINIKYYE